MSLVWLFVLQSGRDMHAGELWTGPEEELSMEGRDVNRSWRTVRELCRSCETCARDTRQVRALMSVIRVIGP